MTSSKEKAAEFRRQAAICFDLAQRISLKEEQERMMQVAEHWLELAKRAEAEADQPTRVCSPEIFHKRSRKHLRLNILSLHSWFVVGVAHVVGTETSSC